MEDIILDILAELRAGRTVDDRALVKIIHAQARRDGAEKRTYAKRRLLPYYQRVKCEEPARWASWGVTPELEGRLLAVLRMKPRRSASGVATITVITKPWPCSSACRYCPNDVRCPKSYLHDEPACERAEQNFFDPYLQVRTRLAALEQMGHATGKVELIVLGGTWTDYPLDYQLWFVSELFRALNEGDEPAGDRLEGHVSVATGEPEKGRPVAGGGPGDGQPQEGAGPAEGGQPVVGGEPEEGRSVADGGPGDGQPVAGGGPLHAAAGAAPCRASHVEAAPPADVAARRAWYRCCGVPEGEEELAAFTRAAQAQVDAGALTYNAAVRELYGQSAAWARAASIQHATEDALERLQRENETARHRAVGLVFETRPDAITAPALARARQMGATKIQMGVQSLDQQILDANDRGIEVARIQAAFELLRAFGFKIHVHAMLNLRGATPAADKADYRRLVGDAAFKPDEVKLYPCALIEGTGLCADFACGSWAPYTEEELLDVLCADVLATPPFTRVSRMIRDFSSEDIVAGNKKPNLRQLVEERLRAQEAAGDGGPGDGGPGDGDTGSAPAVQEIRFREVGTEEVDRAALRMERVPYQTSNTREWFLQWVTPEGRIAGFLRLSVPDGAWTRAHAAELPPELREPGGAMIREVHVYGMATQLGAPGRAAQHRGLGRELVEAACGIAAAAGCTHVSVISAVGTREYYRGLGFADGTLYQRKEL